MQIGNQGTEIVNNYPVSLTASSEARRSELGHAHNGYLLGRKEGRQGGEEERKGGKEGQEEEDFRIYHLEVTVRNLFSRERFLDQGRMPENERVIDKLPMNVLR